MGEAAIFGFLKGYPSDMVGDVASGMGFSGIFGTGCLLVCKAANISNQTIFMIQAPTFLFFFIAFQWLVEQKKKYPYMTEN
jgi:hypothetical protein